jgi:hypothetical protein
MASPWHNPETILAKLAGTPLGGGTSKPFLVESENGKPLVVKFPNQKWKCQLLINEMLSAILLEKLELPTPRSFVVEFPCASNDKDATEGPFSEALAEARAVCTPLKCLGLEYFGDYHEKPADETISESTVENLEAVYGAVVFDTWVFNQDARHFLARKGKNEQWDLMLFDNDGAFNRHDWILHNRVRTDTNYTRLQEWLVEALKTPNRINFERGLTALEEDGRWLGLTTADSLLPEAWKQRLTPDATKSLGALLADLDTRRKLIRKIMFALQVA